MLKVYESSIPGKIQYVGPEVDNVINSLQESWGQIEECNLFELRVILNELILNAVKHGSKEDFNKLVRIAVNISDGDHVSISIEDDGEGCDYKYLLNASAASCSDGDIFSLKETGRGLLIVKNLCDSLEFNKKGNIIKIEKRLVRAYI
ncbi:MAG: ATP-binding protein [Acetivibrionales bacterium]